MWTKSIHSLYAVKIHTTHTHRVVEKNEDASHHLDDTQNF